VQRLDWKATAGEGHRVGESQQRANDVVDAPAAVACVWQWEKKMLLCFF
jgi:hypothetical protein